jgi:hypothetical protein
MNPKGRSSVDLEPAESATSRRSLIRTAGTAGVVGAAVALASRPAVAAPAPVPPNDVDTALLQQAMILELTASDLYQVALSAGVSSGITELFEVIAANHTAYAQSIAGVAGLSASGRNDEVFDSLSEQFADDSVLAAHQLEQTAVSTHTALLGTYESARAVNLTASIVVVEARHATVLADVAGVTDLDIVFGDDQPPLDLAGASA